MNLTILDIEKMKNAITDIEQQILSEQDVSVGSQCDDEGKQALKILHFIRAIIDAGLEDE